MIRRHDDIMAECHYLLVQGLSLSRLSDEPLIHSGQGARKGNTNSEEVPPETRGDIAAHGFYKSGTTCIFDVQIVDTDAPSYRHLGFAKVLENKEKQKKNKHL